MPDPRCRLVPLSDDDVAQWRAARGSLPEAAGTETLELLEAVVGDVAVGGVALGHGGTTTTVRLLETSLADDDVEHWSVVVAALEAHAREHGSATLVARVHPRLVAPFVQAGFRATTTGVGVTVPPERPRLVTDTGRVRLRPMDDGERRTYATDALGLLRDGMTRAGVLDAPDAPMPEVERRLAPLADDVPPADEVLLTATLDGEAVGRVWATLVDGADGAEGRDLLVNSFDLAPEHRGRGLTRHLLAAVETYVREHDLRDVRARVYAHDVRARRTLADIGLGVDDVHLRKDLRHLAG